ncbi:unnamed protein product [Rotaria socialis]|uniref:Uncharacterized protein n=1 Tax=Rotaria socialis TaxID=392032 RepID=A0A818AJS4_9BILA|nr:unnamed protein product [Rotaria socialis]
MEKKPSKSFFFKEDDEIQSFHHRLNELSFNNNISTPATILEVDETQTDSLFQTLSSDSKQIFNSLTTSTKSESKIYQLGLEFLHGYDGKFNYPEGHTLVMIFEKRPWLLTIEKIKCVECRLGESEPRSLLMLSFEFYLFFQYLIILT